MMSVLNPIALRKAKIVYNFGLSILAFLNAIELKERILSFIVMPIEKKEAKMKMAEVLSVNVYPFSLNIQSPKHGLC